jgi:hypothetical protein
VPGVDMQLLDDSNYFFSAMIASGDYSADDQKACETNSAPLSLNDILQNTYDPMKSSTSTTQALCENQQLYQLLRKLMMTDTSFMKDSDMKDVYTKKLYHILYYFLGILLMIGCIRLASPPSSA